MVDSRFYESLGPIRLADLAALVGGRLLRSEDADVSIEDIGSLGGASAAKGAIGFLDGPKKFPQLESSGLTACFAKPSDAERAAAMGVRVVAVDRPHLAFATATRALSRPHVHDYGSSGVHPTAEIGEGVVLGPGALVAQNARIGARTVVGPNAVIGAGVEIGPDSDIGPGVLIRIARIGARCRVHANAVIGESGYGLVHAAGDLVERPHVGRVIIGEGVRIGACTTIDRGAIDDTTIDDGTKIDNLVQIAHNVRVGKRCIIAGCTGISGSAVIEDGAMLGGSVGITDHVRVGAGARLAGATLVMRDVPPGEAWSGAPARPIRQFFRELVALERLASRGGGSSSD
jgi:UDP-3-O-[3-hydroxymyristoyl] glucosamine N-acyltransferase